MGQAKNKKTRFLQSNPNCCFCDGKTPATTIDHVPNRACFVGRAAPEGFEFPACNRCQRATRLDEIPFSAMVHFSDQDSNNFDGDNFDRVMTGMKNNFPELLPDLNLTSRDKRQAIKAFDLPKPKGMTLKDTPIAGIPVGYNKYILRYLSKIMVALYYREQQRIMPETNRIWVTWNFAANGAGIDAREKWIAMTPTLTVGTRTNLNFGNRFGYRCNKNASDPDVLAVYGQFGLGLQFYGIVIEQESIWGIEESEDFKTLSEIMQE